MKGALIIHGFAGSPDELLPLYNFLTLKGMKTSMPTLKGHCSGRNALARSTRREWLKSAETAYINLNKTCSDITVIGFSMGGLLAVKLYQKYKFHRLVTVNTPVYYWNIAAVCKNLLSDFKYYKNKYVSSAMPVKAMWQFQRLLSETKPAFRNIDCPSLVIQTRNDDAVNPVSGRYIFKYLRGKKRIITPETGGHDIFTGGSCFPIIADIYKYVKNKYGFTYIRSKKRYVLIKMFHAYSPKHIPLLPFLPAAKT